MNAHGDPSVEARSFATFLGAFREPVSRAQLSRFAQELGFRSSSGRPYSVRITNRWLTELEDAGWVEFRPKKFVVGASDRRCALGATLRERYEPMALREALEAILPLPATSPWSMTIPEAETVLTHAWLALLLDDEATLLSCSERLDDPHELFGATQQLALIEDLSPDDLDRLPIRSLRHGLAQSLLSGALLALPAEATAARALHAPVSDWSPELAAALGLYLLARGEAEFGFHELDLYAKTASPVDPIVLATQATLGYVSGHLQPGPAARALDGALRAYRKQMGAHPRAASREARPRGPAAERHRARRPPEPRRHARPAAQLGELRRRRPGRRRGVSDRLASYWSASRRK